MDALEKLIRENCWRFPKGYPDSQEDINYLKTLIEQQLPLFSDEELDALTVKVKTGEEDVQDLDKDEIYALLDLNKDDKEFISLIRKKLKSQPKRKLFDKIAANANIDKSTMESANAPDDLFNMLIASDDVDNFVNYINSGQLSLNSLKSDKVGNIIKDLENSKLSSRGVTNLVNYGGSEGGRGVGKAELAMALLLKDVEMRVGESGDLSWNDEYLEVKGTAGRLGKRDDKFKESADILDVRDKYEDLEGAIRPDQFIPILIQKGENKNQILKQTRDLANKMYPSAENINDVIALNTIEDPLSLRKSFQKIMADNYIKNEGVKHFLFVDTKNRFGNYIIKSAEEIDGYIESNPTKFSNPISLNQKSPQTFTNGI